MAGYGSDDGFEAWAEENGHALPDGDVAAARQRGSAYIDGTYGLRFPGSPTAGVAQEREWPRTGATDWYGNAIESASVPLRVVYASYEAALLELGKPGLLSRTFAPAEQKVLTEVKGIKWTVTGDAKGEYASVPISTKIEGLLAPLLMRRDFPAVLAV